MLANGTSESTIQFFLDSCGAYQHVRMQDIPSVAQSAQESLVGVWSNAGTSLALLTLFVLHEALVATRNRRPRRRSLA